jgi:hypothetical protein
MGITFLLLKKGTRLMQKPADDLFYAKVDNN